MKLHIQGHQFTVEIKDEEHERKKTRKDSGQRAISAAAALAGIEMPAPLHKILIKNGFKDEFQVKMEDFEVISSEAESIF